MVGVEAKDSGEEREREREREERRGSSRESVWLNKQIQISSTGPWRT